jgi:hypothetical protein
LTSIKGLFTLGHRWRSPVSVTGRDTFVWIGAFTPGHCSAWSSHSDATVTDKVTVSRQSPLEIHLF